MAWIKIPAENHPLFHAALPKDPRISTLNMFGGVAAMVNGNMFGGLFARSALVKLAEADQQEAMRLDGAEPFDPMGNGRVMKDTIMLPDSVMDEPGELRDWLRKAFDYAATLPPKQKKAPKKIAEKKVKKAATKPAAKKSAPAARSKPAARARAAPARVTARPAKRR